MERRPAICWPEGEHKPPFPADIKNASEVFNAFVFRIKHPAQRFYALLQIVDGFPDSAAKFLDIAFDEAVENYSLGANLQAKLMSMAVGTMAEKGQFDLAEKRVAEIKDYPFYAIEAKLAITANEVGRYSGLDKQTSDKAKKKLPQQVRRLKNLVFGLRDNPLHSRYILDDKHRGNAACQTFHREDLEDVLPNALDSVIQAYISEGQWEKAVKIVDDFIAFFNQNLDLIADDPEHAKYSNGLLTELKARKLFLEIFTQKTPAPEAINSAKALFKSEEDQLAALNYTVNKLESYRLKAASEILLPLIDNYWHLDGFKYVIARIVDDRWNKGSWISKKSLPLNDEQKKKIRSRFELVSTYASLDEALNLLEFLAMLGEPIADDFRQIENTIKTVWETSPESLARLAKSQLRFRGQRRAALNNLQMAYSQLAEKKYEDEDECQLYHDWTLGNITEALGDMNRLYSFPTDPLRPILRESKDDGDILGLSSLEDEEMRLIRDGIKPTIPPSGTIYITYGDHIFYPFTVTKQGNNLVVQGIFPDKSLINSLFPGKDVNNDSGDSREERGLRYAWTDEGKVRNYTQAGFFKLTISQSKGALRMFQQDPRLVVAEALYCWSDFMRNEGIDVGVVADSPQWLESEHIDEEGKLDLGTGPNKMRISIKGDPQTHIFIGRAGSAGQEKIFLAQEGKVREWWEIDCGASSDTIKILKRHENPMTESIDRSFYLMIERPEEWLSRLADNNRSTSNYESQSWEDPSLIKATINFKTDLLVINDDNDQKNHPDYPWAVASQRVYDYIGPNNRIRSILPTLDLQIIIARDIPGKESPEMCTRLLAEMKALLNGDPEGITSGLENILRQAGLINL